MTRTTTVTSLPLGFAVLLLLMLLGAVVIASRGYAKPRADHS